MDSSLSVFERFIARLTGPMHVRFIVQPAMAILLGIRDGVRDAGEGRPPFLWSVCTQRERRKAQLRKALERLTIPLMIAILLDAVVQYMLFRTVRLWGAVLVGTILMGLPYSIARSISNRVASRIGRRPAEIRPDPY